MVDFNPTLEDRLRVVAAHSVGHDIQLRRLGGDGGLDDPNSWYFTYWKYTIKSDTPESKYEIDYSKLSSETIHKLDMIKAEDRDDIVYCYHKDGSKYIPKIKNSWNFDKCVYNIGGPTRMPIPGSKYSVGDRIIADLFKGECTINGYVVGTDETKLYIIYGDPRYYKNTCQFDYIHDVFVDKLV